VRNGTKHCYICNSPNHLRAQCPKNTGGAQGSRLGVGSGNVKKVNTCQLGADVNQTQECCNEGLPTSHLKDDKQNCEGRSTFSNNVLNEMQAQDGALEEAAGLFCCNPSGYASVNEVLAVAKRQPDFVSTGNTSPVNKLRSISPVIPMEHMSRFSYLPVKVGEAPTGGRFPAVAHSSESTWLKTLTGE